MKRLLREGESVAKALGIELHGEARQMIAEGAAAPGKRKVSMLQDVLAERDNRSGFREWRDRGLRRKARRPGAAESRRLAAVEGPGTLLD